MLLGKLHISAATLLPTPPKILPNHVWEEIWEDFWEEIWEELFHLDYGQHTLDLMDNYFPKKAYVFVYKNTNKIFFLKNIFFILRTIY